MQNLACSSLSRRIDRHTIGIQDPKRTQNHIITNESSFTQFGVIVLLLLLPHNIIVLTIRLRCPELVFLFLRVF